jgi:hypothetical protein
LRVEVLECRALLSTVFKGTFTGTFHLARQEGIAEFVTTGKVRSNSETAEGRAFAGVVCTLKAEAKIKEAVDKRILFTNGSAELINPDFEVTLIAGFSGSESPPKFTLEGANLPHKPKMFEGSPPFRLYPEGEFTVIGQLSPRSDDVKISFTIDLTKD